MPRISGRPDDSCARQGITKKSATNTKTICRMVWYTPPAISAGCFFGLELANLIHSSTKTGFKTLISGLVVSARRKVVRQALQVGYFVFEIVSVNEQQVHGFGCGPVYSEQQGFCVGVNSISSMRVSS